MKNKIISTFNSLKKTDIYVTLSHSKNYLMADIATKALSVLSLPIMTRLLTPADYGIISIFGTYVMIFAVLLPLNAFGAISRYYYEEKSDFGEFIGNSFLLGGCAFLITALIFIVFREKFSIILSLPSYLILIILLSSLFALITSVYAQILLPQRKSKQFSVVNVVQAYLTFIFSISFVYYLKESKYLGIIMAQLLIGAIFSVYFLSTIIRYIKFRYNFSHIKYILSYSVPLIPYCLSGVILAQFDRIMINNSRGLTETGLYSLAYNVGMLLTLVIGSTQTALMPDFFGFINRGEHGRLDSLVKRVFIIILIAALGLILFSKEIVVILAAPKFHASLWIVPIIVIGYVFYALYTIYGRYFGVKNNTVWDSIIALSAGALNIYLNALYIPRYGYGAAAYATLVSYVVMFLGAWVVVKYILKRKVISLRLLLNPLSLMFIFVIIYYALFYFSLNVYLLFAIRCILLICFVELAFSNEMNKLLRQQSTNINN